MNRQKWLVAKRRGNAPIRETRFRFRTKKEAQKKASKLNKAYKGTKIKCMHAYRLEKKTMALITEEKHLSKLREKSWFDEWKLATFKDGFIIGIFSALVLQLGIINITTALQKSIVFVFLLFGILTSVNQALRRKALISPPWDGFFSGFGTLLGIIDLLFPELLIL